MRIYAKYIIVIIITFIILVFRTVLKELLSLSIIKHCNSNNIFLSVCINRKEKNEIVIIGNKESINSRIYNRSSVECITLNRPIGTLMQEINVVSTKLQSHIAHCGSAIYDAVNNFWQDILNLINNSSNSQDNAFVQYLWLMYQCYKRDGRLKDLTEIILQFNVKDNFISQALTHPHDIHNNASKNVIESNVRLQPSILGNYFTFDINFIDATISYINQLHEINLDIYICQLCNDIYVAQFATNSKYCHKCAPISKAETKKMYDINQKGNKAEKKYNAVRRTLKYFLDGLGNENPYKEECEIIYGNFLKEAQRMKKKVAKNEMSADAFLNWITNQAEVTKRKIYSEIK